jgi:hypothetical protein
MAARPPASVKSRTASGRSGAGRPDPARAARYPWERAAASGESAGPPRKASRPAPCSRSRWAVTAAVPSALATLTRSTPAGVPEPAASTTGTRRASRSTLGRHRAGQHHHAVGLGGELEVEAAPGVVGAGQQHGVAGQPGAALHAPQDLVGEQQGLVALLHLGVADAGAGEPEHPGAAGGQAVGGAAGHVPQVGTARSTRSRVAGRRSPGRRSARDTVAIETPASRATW